MSVMRKPKENGTEFGILCLNKFLGNSFRKSKTSDFMFEKSKIVHATILVAKRMLRRSMLCVFSFAAPLTLQ